MALNGSACGRCSPIARLWILSDLHLEAAPYPAAFRPARPAFDVLVAAGDICEGSARAVGVVAALAGGRPTVFVLGNHEPWRRDLAAECRAARRAAEVSPPHEAPRQLRRV